ncbi:MAG: hypothetical protein ABIQ05_01955 [Candidatus Limnocylindria bacterium]
MSENPRSDRRAPANAALRQAAPVLALLVLLALASLVPSDLAGAALRIASADRTRAGGMDAAFARLPERALVLVAFDADLGTYAETRPVVRAAIADLRARGARLAIVSFTAEGRALAVAELLRLRRLGAGSDEIADLGFAGAAEAGLIGAISGIVPRAAEGSIAEAIRSRGADLDAFALVLVVSGGDLSVRSWVEQVLPRVPDLPIVAIAPTFLEPELAPYLRTGQLHALLATVPEGLAYVDGVPAADRSRAATVGAMPMLLGLLVALGVMAQSLLAPLMRRSRPDRWRRIG